MGFYWGTDPESNSSYKVKRDNAKVRGETDLTCSQYHKSRHFQDNTVNCEFFRVKLRLGIQIVGVLNGRISRILWHYVESRLAQGNHYMWTPRSPETE